MVEGALGLLTLVCVYFLPSIVAEYRGHHDAMSIIILNLFLGWTLLFWVIALAWALSHVENRFTSRR